MRAICWPTGNPLEPWLAAPSMERFLAERLATGHRCD
jgi:hypothetical protein